MPKLTATPEMKQAAIADEPKQHESPYGYRYVERTYYPYMNCVVRDGILKAAFYLPEHLRLDGNNPAYEVFLDKKAHQFLTYDHLEKKWRDAKLDRLNWPGRNYYATCWASEKDTAIVQDYLCGERGGDLGILDFQRNVRDEQLEQRHKRITGAWDQDLAQVPELPKDWTRWIDKVAVRENFIFYRYKRGGAKSGYCTFCGKEVPISGHPYHNKKGRCACCRHPIVFKALGRAGYIRTEKDYAYLIQGARMALFSVNSGQRGLTGKTVCPLESLTGMSFAVRFMTAVEKYALTIGACIASGKHAGFPVIPATIVTVAIRQAGSMARAFPAWNRRSCSALALCSGYAPIR